MSQEASDCVSVRVPIEGLREGNRVCSPWDPSWYWCATHACPTEACWAVRRQQEVERK